MERFCTVDIEVLAPADLDLATAYALWRLRQDVFVVEQACPYPDLDGRDLDPGARHVVVRREGAVVGCARVLDEGAHLRVGRVVLTRSLRGKGLADLLMGAVLSVVGDRPSVLEAQAPLAPWYASLGYAVTGPEFLEDGIPHVPMRRPGGGG